MYGSGICERGRKEFLDWIKIWIVLDNCHLNSNEQTKEPEQKHTNSTKMTFIKKIVFEGDPNEQINN